MGRGRVTFDGDVGEGEALTMTDAVVHRDPVATIRA
jgi:hypothetical protein